MAKLYGIVALVCLLGLVGVAWAVDGVVDINQARALAGGVSPGDTAGFPVTISQSGSYRLTGNLTVSNENTTAISVQADYVTIDLNGFSIQGPVVCTGTPVTSCSPGSGTGVGVDPAIGRVGIVVRGGSVHGMGSYGISRADRVENVIARSNGDSGIRNGLVVTNCIANGNGGFGIDATGMVANSTASGNLSYGIATNNNVIDCVANGNGGGGIYALGVVANCDAASNVGYGIAGPAGAVTNSRAYSNSVFGVEAITATGCFAAFNGGSPQISATGITGQNICGSPGSPCP